MSHVNDLVGRSFGRLTVLKRAGSSKQGRAAWLCLCQCGNEHIYASPDLLYSGVISCGCYRREALDRTTHGLKHTPEYKLWLGIRKRCYRKEEPNFKHYGGRGIKVADEWKDNPVAFAEYVRTHLGPKPTPQHSLDRIDNDGNYEPGNLRWATRKEQNNNQRPRRLATPPDNRSGT